MTFEQLRAAAKKNAEERTKAAGQTPLGTSVRAYETGIDTTKPLYPQAPQAAARSAPQVEPEAPKPAAPKTRPAFQLDPAKVEIGMPKSMLVSRQSGVGRGGRETYTPTPFGRAAGVLSGSADSFKAAIAGADALALESRARLDQSAEQLRQNAADLIRKQWMLRGGTQLSDEERAQLQQEIADSKSVKKQVQTIWSGPVPDSLTMKAADALYDQGAKLRQQSGEALEFAKQGLNSVGRFGVDVASGAVQLGADIAAAYLTGGASATASMAVRSAGNAALTGKESGADFQTRSLYATGSGALSALVSKISNAPGFMEAHFGQGLAQKIAGSEFFSHLVTQLGADGAAEAVGQLAQTAAGRTALTTLSEGVKGFAENLGQTYLQRATILPDAQYNLNQAGYDALLRGATGGILSAASNFKPHAAGSMERSMNAGSQNAGTSGRALAAAGELPPSNSTATTGPTSNYNDVLMRAAREFGRRNEPIRQGADALMWFAQRGTARDSRSTEGIWAQDLQGGDTSNFNLTAQPLPEPAAPQTVRQIDTWPEAASTNSLLQINQNIQEKQTARNRKFLTSYPVQFGSDRNADFANNLSIWDPSAIPSTQYDMGQHVKALKAILDRINNGKSFGLFEEKITNYNKVGTSSLAVLDNSDLADITWQVYAGDLENPSVEYHSSLNLEDTSDNFQLAETLYNEYTRQVHAGDLEKPSVEYQTGLNLEDTSNNSQWAESLYNEYVRQINAGNLEDRTAGYQSSLNLESTSNNTRLAEVLYSEYVRQVNAGNLRDCAANLASLYQEDAANNTRLAEALYSEYVRQISARASFGAFGEGSVSVILGSGFNEEIPEVNLNPVLTELPEEDINDSRLAPTLYADAVSRLISSTISDITKLQSLLEPGSAISETIVDNRNMAMGFRKPASHILTEEEISSIIADAKAIGVPVSVLRFNQGTQTGFRDSTALIYIRGDILPDRNSTIARDRMSSRAVLAHEYYGHYKHHPSEYAPGDWNDEFRASYEAAIDAPNLSDEDRSLLMLDAYDRAREAGFIKEYDEKAKEIIYGLY